MRNGKTVMTISKRFEFSASHRLNVPAWSAEKNRGFFGGEHSGQWGHGHNFVVFFVFSGPVDERNGMMINVTTIKQRIAAMLNQRFDHKFLNKDTPPFDGINPTVENLARCLLDGAVPLFNGENARPVACHLEESPTSAATAYAGGGVERHLTVDFSAARRTFSPWLTDGENQRLFGIAGGRHGHHYVLRVTLAGTPDPVHGLLFPEQGAMDILADFCRHYDHRELGDDFPEFRHMPMTTEMLARCFFHRLQNKIPLHRLRLDENPRFFVEYRGGEKAGDRGDTTMGVSDSFFAAHRLHAPALSEEQNRAVYGVCNNPNGHGHGYRVEFTVGGRPDEKSGTLFGLGRLNHALAGALEPWTYRHLDRETADFKDKPSTGENILRVLWDRLAGPPDPVRLRLWETPNNRFTLRRCGGGDA